MARSRKRRYTVVRTYKKTHKIPAHSPYRRRRVSALSLHLRGVPKAQRALVRHYIKKYS